MPYDVEGARKAGLSDGEIATALAARTNYDLEGAKKAGVPDSDIVNALVTKFNQSFPLSGDQQGQQPTGMRPGKAMLERAGEMKNKAVQAIMLRDPGVDYETGVKDFGLRAGFGRMSNDTERENYLAKNVGQGNFGKDRYGRYYIHPEGLAKLGINSAKPQALDESSTSRYDVADVLGDAPAMAGATGGALMASGAGFIPGVASAALGAAGGKAIDELVKRGQGYNLKGAGEQATTLAGEAAAGGLGEGVGRTLIGAGRFAANPYGMVSNPERQTLTREAQAAGFAPKVFQFQPDGSLLGRFQSMGENVLGDTAKAQNKEAMEAGLSSLRDVAGKEVPDIGERLINRVTGYTSDLAAQAISAKNKAMSMLDESLFAVRKSLGAADPNAGLAVQDQIKAARQQFGKDASALYSKVDALAGGKPIVPTASVKQQLSDLMANLPTDQTGQKIFPTPELKQFFAKYGDIADMQTTSQMQQLRTDFRNAAESMNLVPGVDKYRARLLKNSVDAAFDDATQSATRTISTTSPILDASGKAITTTSTMTSQGSPEAIAALRAADEFYKAGIKKFDAPSIAALTRDASQTGAVEAGRVVDTIIRPGYTAAAARVKSLVSPETWGKVQREHFESLLADGTHLIDGVPSVNGASVLKKINDMGSTFNVVYGKQAPAIKQYVSELAARDGKLDPSLLQGDIAVNLQKAATKQRELDNFLSNNYLSQLAKPGHESVQAADFIFKPNSPMRIAEAKRFYDETSKEFQGLQNNAMNKILEDLVQPGEDPIKKIFDGKALKGTLNKYGYETLAEMFGKDTTNDLYKFADIAQFVTQKNPHAGGIVAATVALHPLRNVWKILDLAGTGYLLRQPGAIRWLSEGIALGDKAEAAGAISRLGSLATAIVKDKTSSGSMDLNRPQYQQQP
jgi:hypothetical protein